VELALGSLAETEGRKLYRAVVVCSMGFATSRILSVNIEKTFQNIKVIDQLSVAMIPKYNFKSIDLVLSTVDISIMLTKPVIVINPMLNREDIKKIHQYINDESNQEIKLMQYTRIMDLLKQEAGIEDLEHMAGNLRNIMGISEKEEARKGLFDLMLPEFCHMTDRVANWEEGVWKAAEPLLEAGCIQKTYIEEIIRVKNEYQNYYLVGENLSMPHAAPEAGVNRMAISMIVLREPLQVTLKSEKTIKIWVILILAAVDNHQHAKALQEISDIFEQEETVKKLSNSRSSEDLYKVLKKISGNFLDT
jgi:mannitol/fructose-specific phosphotransferase system IIA component (Ntr-type)/galactitol-specific phosphotransferase system IIB component